ncbi:glycosyltransferase family 2 protein [Anaerolineales bacterium]
MQMPLKTLVILPAYNEEQSIKQTLLAISQILPQADLLVINDGSIDRTTASAREAGAIVLELPYNVGIGAAVQTGFIYAARYQYDLVIRNDGDGQHQPDNLPECIALFETEKLDVLIGSRFLNREGDYGTSMPRKLGIRILTTLLSTITHQSVTDPTSGFGLYNRRAIALFSRLYPHDYPEPEAIVMMHRAGLRWKETPIRMQARQYGTSSFQNPFRSAYYMVKVVLAILVNLLRKKPDFELE